MAAKTLVDKTPSDVLYLPNAVDLVSLLCQRSKPRCFMTCAVSNTRLFGESRTCLALRAPILEDGEKKAQGEARY